MAEQVFVFPLSLAQQRLWLMDQLLPGTSLFNLNTAWRLKTAINVDVLERSLNEIVRRHEALRTTFAVVDEQPSQIIAPEMKLKLLVSDLSGLPPHEREQRATRLASEEAQKPFDLRRGPLIRASLLRLGEQDHVFLLTMHHIVSDGWSMGIFWHELGVLWSAFAQGRPSPLPELPIQYADYAVWQREWLEGEVLNSQLAYWKKQLADLPVLQLPTDHPRPLMQTFNGARYNLTLPASLTAQLKELSRREGVTLFMTLLAAFEVLLYRYTSQEDIVIGSYIAGRNRAEIEGLIGFFLNSLVLRIGVNGEETFAQLLSRVRRLTLDADANQDVPFAKLVEELQPERDLSRNPLFQVMFQLLNVPTLSDIAAGAKPELLETPWVTSVFDLSCMLMEEGDYLSGHFEYNTDLFDPATIVRMARHYRTILEGIVADPARRVADLPLLTTEERQQLLVEWNGSSRDLCALPGLVQLFEEQVAQSTDSTAFICGAEKISYQELNRRANQLAHHLRAQGIAAECLVGICLERSLDLPVALLATLKSGGVYLPLDPSYPPERLAMMLRDARPKVLLTERRHAESLPQDDARRLYLDEEREAISRQSEANPAQPAQDADARNRLAYVIYTSGSTGRPKGIAVEHKQILNRLAWMWERYPFQPHEVSCQKTSLNFVDSIWELLGPLLKGIRTVIIPEGVMKDPYALIRTLAEHRVTRIWVVPSMLRLLLEADPHLQDRLPLLNFWVSSGEALPADLVERFEQRLPRSVLYNLYGNSEAWDVTWYTVPPRTGPGQLWRVPIGQPISAMQAYVLDANLTPVPVGVPGELYVAGVGLARGYLNQPEMTAARFLPNPFSDEPSARMYRTGDLARYRQDGNLEYLERLDHQIKLRGFRIELGELETALAQHPGVKDAVATTRQVRGDERLVAYVVARSEGGVTAAALRDFLRERLPEYMIPATFVMLEALPHTPSGKVNRRALPEPEAVETEQSALYVAPQTEIERTIAHIWQEVLGVKRVGLRDKFFDLGGHSLLMFQVHIKLSRALNKEFSMMDLFRYPTVETLAQFFSDGRDGRRSLDSLRDRIQKRKEALNRQRQVAAAEEVI